MPTAFVPETLDATDFTHLEPLIRALLDRPLMAAGDVEAWLLDRSDLYAAISEGRARLYIAMTCNTEDEGAQQAYARYIEDVAPKLTPLFFELDRKLVEAANTTGLNMPRYAVLLRNAKADVDLFRPENVLLETQLAQLAQRYDQVAGAMTVEFDGREQTLPQMARYQEMTDRAVRERAWRASAARRLRDRDTIDAIYDEMVALRDRVAKNAGYADYVGYAFTSKHRFDYDVAACVRFHDGVADAIVPLVRALEDERRRSLGVERLCPWDLSVDVKGRPPLRPFEGGADLIRKGRVVMHRLDHRLAGLFEQLGDGTGRVQSAADVGRVMLDLDSRKGKAPGGYQYNLDRLRKPFIFMNAAGMHRDVETLVHEAGHAFHSMLCADEPLSEYRESPTEFAEVASMSMELLTMRHWGPSGDGREGFYPNEEDFRRACRDQLKHSVLLLPWIATIDAFQHWVYTHPGHTRAARTAQWLAIDDRFGSSVSWAGLEDVRASLWHRQMHLFDHPLYYIEYGIAQLGALQLWLHALEAGEASAVERYMRALRLGGSRPLPALFEAAGLTFDFGPETVRRLADRVRAELAKIPE
ncbi:MAG: oligoendopeptidase F [Phycisphaerae bacterium]|nr:MAG: oligoendopeptidase F [Phycisphaerae bacterium]